MLQHTELRDLGWARLLKSDLQHAEEARCATWTRHHKDTFCKCWDLFFATAFSAFGGVQSGPLLAQKLFCKAGPRATVHTPRVGHAHTQTHRQKWKLQQKASQHHPGDNTEIRKHIWLTLVSLSRNYHLLQSLWGELVTTGKQVKKKVPHLLKLRNNGSNFFTINTNRILGVRKLSMILKASDLVC